MFGFSVILFVLECSVKIFFYTVVILFHCNFAYSEVRCNRPIKTFTYITECLSENTPSARKYLFEWLINNEKNPARSSDLEQKLDSIRHKLNKFDYLYLKGLLANKFKSNNKEAIRFFSLANDLGSADAGLSLYLSTKDRINAKTALQYLQVSADRGNIEASVLFWKVLVLGSDITTEQGMLGVKYLEQAASMGNSESIELLLNDASRFLNKSQHNYWSLIFELYYQNIEEKDLFSINEIYDWSDFCQRFKRFDPEITENRKALNKRNLMILGQLVNGCFKKNK